MTWETVQKKVEQQQKFQVVYRIVTRSGGIRWVWEQGNGIFSSAGELLALEGFIADISSKGDSALILTFQQLFRDEMNA